MLILGTPKCYVRSLVIDIDKQKVIVVGGGAAGMMAAGVCAQNGANVILLEKNNMLGKKLRITGKGRCNIANNCDAQTFMSNVPRNGKFLYSAINRFSSNDTINFFESRGLVTKTERGNRVFPCSDKAIDVVKILESFVVDSGCEILNEVAKELIIGQGKCEGITTRTGMKIFADAVILATGGLSYPRTGSTGDGYKMAQKVGHTVVSPRASLVPLESSDEFCADLQGLSLRNVSIELIEKSSNKVVFKDFGEMLFTHFGLSGPIILSASAHMLKNKSYAIKIDLKPALSMEQLDKRILRDFEKYQNKDFSNALGDLLPRKLIPVIIKLSGIPTDLKCHQITKAMRFNLLNVLKSLTVNISGMRPVDEAIITSGGIKTAEINPKTMESKLVKGLYFAGEVIDVDAYTGGFNLQIAFSTGHLAGDAAANRSD